MFRRKNENKWYILPNLNTKNNYILHYKETLTQAAQHIVFDQTAWLKSYIDLNIMLRTKAKNEFELD